MQAYEGPTKPSHEVAFIKPLVGIIIESINGDITKRAVAFGNFGSTDFDIALTPGEHTLILSYDTVGRHSTETLTFPITVRAGRKYIIKPVLTGYNTWSARMEDVTNFPDQWCILGKDCI